MAVGFLTRMYRHIDVKMSGIQLRFTSILCLLLVGLYACSISAPPPAQTSIASPPSPYEPNYGVPVKNVDEAERFAEWMIDVETRIWLPDPQPYSIQQMDFAAAVQRAGTPVNYRFQNVAPNTPVWLVILRGHYQVLPPGTQPTPGADTLGCVWVLFTTTPENNTTDVYFPRECP